MEVHQVKLPCEVCALHTLHQTRLLARAAVVRGAAPQKQLGICWFILTSRSESTEAPSS